MTGNPRNQAENDTYNSTYESLLISEAVVEGITYKGQVIAPVTLANFAINSTGDITPTTEVDKVDYYKAVYTGYAKLNQGGTLFINIFSNELKHTGVETLKSGFAAGCKMIDYASADESIKSACTEEIWINSKEGSNNYDKYAIVNVGDTTYCVINFVNTNLTINTTAALVARAYDASGKMLTQVSVS